MCLFDEKNLAESNVESRRNRNVFYQKKKYN